MTRRGIAVLILGLWGGAMAWLLARESARPEALLLDDTERAVEPGAMYYSVFMADVPIGFASHTVDTVPEGLLIEERIVLEVPAPDTLDRTEVRTVARLTNTLRLIDFEATLRGQSGRYGAVGDVSGDTVLNVVLEGADGRQTVRIPLDAPIVLPAYMPLRIAFGGDLAVGNRYSVRTFDPLLLAHQDVTVQVVAESTLFVPDSSAFDEDTRRWVGARVDTVRAWKVRQEANGIATEAWMDGFGRMVSATSAVGFRLERTAFELAFHNFRLRDTAAAGAPLANADVIRKTAIAANVSVNGSAAELRIRLGGMELEGFDLDGGRQRLVGDTLIVTREADTIANPGYRLPARASRFDFVSPEPMIQSDDPRIQAQARQVIGRTRDPVEAATLLLDFVYRELRKESTISVPSAPEILETRRGDCNEHTILYVAMARAVGLPARTAAGLVHVDGHFYYHAWPEVFLGEWIAVDPTFGQFPAAASHLRFTIGGLASQVELIRLIGQLTLDVIEVQESP